MGQSLKPLMTPRKLRFWPKTWRNRFLAASGAGLLMLLLAWGLSRATPPWYQPLDRNDTGVIDCSDRAQKRLLELHNAIERVPLGEREWTITQDEINSLLALRFTSPLPVENASKKPAKIPIISDPIVVFTPGKVTLATRSTRIPSGDPRGGVGSAVFSVGIIPGNDGKSMGLVRLSGVWIGDLPVPRSIVESRLRTMAPSIASFIQQLVSLQDTATRQTPAIRDVPKFTTDVEQVVDDIITSRPFPLQHTVNRKRIVIKELLVEEGQFTVVLAPPTPAVVSPRPPE